MFSFFICLLNSPTEIKLTPSLSEFEVPCFPLCYLFIFSSTVLFFLLLHQMCFFSSNRKWVKEHDLTLYPWPVQSNNSRKKLLLKTHHCLFPTLKPFSSPSSFFPISLFFPLENSFSTSNNSRGFLRKWQRFSHFHWACGN